MEIIHLPRKKNIIADLLSRIPERSIYVANSLEFIPDSVDIPDQNIFPGPPAPPAPPGGRSYHSQERKGITGNASNSKTAIVPK
jgi:hypothetical protein